MDVPALPSPNQLLGRPCLRRTLNGYRPCLRSVELEQGTVLVAAGAKLSHGYFSAQRHHFSGRETSSQGTRWKRP